jgi:hypothetical protein
MAEQNNLPLPHADAPSPEEAAFRQQFSDSSTRFSTWFGLFVLSTVSFISLAFQSTRSDIALACISFSMVSSFAGYMSYLKDRGIFVGQKPELYLAGFILALWITGLPVIMNPSNNIAVGINEIVDANLYFSSWGAFVCALVLCGNIIREMYGFDILGHVSPIARTRQGRWYILVFSSLLVIIESIVAHIADHCEDEVMRIAPRCVKTNYAIGASVTGFMFSAAITLFTFKTGPLQLFHEWTAAFIMLIIFTIDLLYVTVGKGPGSSVGNLYLSTWACFILSILIFADCHLETVANRERQVAQAIVASEGNNNTDTDYNPSGLQDLELQENVEDTKGS